jgi:uncharacterized integral membrane protein (TIGR00697 family)
MYKNSEHDEKPFPLLTIITALFVTILVLTPSAASKFIAIGPLVIVGSTLFFPISYIFGDILAEVYGFEKSRRIIWIGLLAQVFAAAMYALIQYWPAANFWHNQDAYNIILGQAPRIVLASITAYFLGEYVNSFIVSKMKYLSGGTAGSRLALRFVVSTIFGEFFDSAVFMTIGFYGTMATGNLVTTIITIWLLKTAYEIVALPFTMKLVAWIKKREGVDTIDYPESKSYAAWRR